MSIDACKFINKFLGIIVDVCNYELSHPDFDFYIFFRDNNLLCGKYQLDHDKISEFILNENNITMTKKLFIDFFQYNAPLDEGCGEWIGIGLDVDYDLTDKEKDIYDKISKMKITYYKQLFEAFETK